MVAASHNGYLNINFNEILFPHSHTCLVATVLNSASKKISVITENWIEQLCSRCLGLLHRNVVK